MLPHGFLIIHGRRRPTPQAIERVGQGLIEDPGMWIPLRDLGHEPGETGVIRLGKSIDGDIGRRHPTQGFFRGGMQFRARR